MTGVDREVGGMSWWRRSESALESHVSVTRRMGGHQVGNSWPFLADRACIYESALQVAGMRVLLYLRFLDTLKGSIE